MFTKSEQAGETSINCLKPLDLDNGLIYACGSGNIDVVNLMFEKYKKVGKFWYLVLDRCLYGACESGCISIVKIIIEKQKKLNLKFGFNIGFYRACENVYKNTRSVLFFIFLGGMPFPYKDLNFLSSISSYTDKVFDNYLLYTFLNYHIKSYKKYPQIISAIKRHLQIKKNTKLLLKSFFPNLFVKCVILPCICYSK